MFLSSGLISGKGSWTAAVAGGVVGGLAGAAVGSANIFGSSTIGQGAGALVGGYIGGALGGATSDYVEHGELSTSTLESAAKGASTGYLSAAIANPGLLLAHAATGGSPIATSLMGAISGFFGDIIIEAGNIIVNKPGDTGVECE